MDADGRSRSSPGLARRAPISGERLIEKLDRAVPDPVLRENAGLFPIRTRTP